MKPLVECIPNFSEGRRPEVVEQIVDSVRSTAGVTLLDYSSDADHNRSVVTFVGDPAGVEAAAFAAIKTAAELIDMREQEGEHPRVGATDVVPFVPIRDMEIADCVEMAERLGKRVGEELGIPVYLYEAAARRPDRVNLATVRKGEYEGLRDEIASNPDRAPDFGPRELGSAGATVIGARAPLIAYNIYLDTDDVEIADKIARAVRHSGGGLRYVKAMGVLVEGQAQVSMNLTDYRKTPVHRIQELVRVEAARYGRSITTAELVGLIPEQALIDSARWYLQLDLFDDDQILERQLESAEGQSETTEQFLESVAAGTPTPGGGSVAALAGALAAALGRMVARTTLGKDKYADVEADMQAAAQEADALRAQLTDAIIEDGQAFEVVLAAYRLPKDDENRSQAIQAALLGAAETPLAVARLALETLDTLHQVATLGNVNATIDAGVGVHMARAAIEGAALNVRVNTSGLADKSQAARLVDEIETILGQSQERAEEVLTQVAQRSGLDN
jgi:glutamate formiminotransferase/formiminotetrahydrofolate cyclodeaminase